MIDTRNGMLAAQHAKAEADAAALSTEWVAEQSGLRYVERSIEDVADLDTRYVAVGTTFRRAAGAIARRSRSRCMMRPAC